MRTLLPVIAVLTTGVLGCAENEPYSCDDTADCAGPSSTCVDVPAAATDTMAIGKMFGGDKFSPVEAGAEFDVEYGEQGGQHIFVSGGAELEEGAEVVTFSLLQPDGTELSRVELELEACGAGTWAVASPRLILEEPFAGAASLSMVIGDREQLLDITVVGEAFY